MPKQIDMNEVRDAMQAHIDDGMRRVRDARKADEPPAVRDERCCLSYWFPKIRDAVPVPRTTVITVPGWWPRIGDVIEGVELDELTTKRFDDLTAAIRAAGRDYGYPMFLRTGQTSGKHEWKRTCLVATDEQVPQHIYALIEFSLMADMFGLPLNVWVAREMLPTAPIAVLDQYGGFPLVPEVRAFVCDGKIVCKHPYWPLGAIAKGIRYFRGDADEEEQPTPLVDESGNPFDDFAERAENRTAKAEALKAAKPLFEKMWDQLDHTEADRVILEVAQVMNGDGAWSVDVLQTNRGVFVTDMAEAHRSFHYPDCQSARKDSTR